MEKTPHRTNFAARPVTLGGRTALHSRSHAGSVSLWEGFTLEKFVKGCLRWVSSYDGAREECEEEEQHEWNVKN